MSEQTFDEAISAVDNPMAAAQAAAAVLQSGGTSAVQLPRVDLPPDTVVSLPGGLLTTDDDLLTKAEVRELTGQDEETLAKAQRNGTFVRYVSTLLECGTVSVGDQKATPHLLKSLYIGDRDALLLAIRRATYGDFIEDMEIVCPSCQEGITINFDLSTDVPTRTLEDPTKRLYDVPLRNGRVAQVRIPTGFDQESVLEHEKLTDAEQNTLLLANVVASINGEPVVGTGPLQRMGLADRKKILAWLSEIQPGPRYDEVRFTHSEGCGEEFPLVITVGDLFRG